MNTKSIFGIALATIIIAGGGVYLFTNNGNAVSNDTDGVARMADKIKIGSGDSPRIDISLCTSQANNTYLCPANALSDFGPADVTDTNTKNVCTVSYDSSKGFSYHGVKKTGEISAGDFVASLTPEGKLANIIRGANSVSIALFIGGSDRIIHTLITDANDYSSEQCLEL